MEGRHSRFTLLGQAFAIELLQAYSTIADRTRFLGRSLDAVRNIMQRAGERDVPCAARIINFAGTRCRSRTSAAMKRTLAGAKTTART